VPTTSNYDRTKKGLAVTRASDNVGVVKQLCSAPRVCMRYMVSPRKG